MHRQHPANSVEVAKKTVPNYSHWTQPFLIHHQFLRNGHWCFMLAPQCQYPSFCTAEWEKVMYYWKWVCHI